MYSKIFTKALNFNKLSKESKGRNFQNSALFRCVGLQEHEMASLCLYAIGLQEFRTHVHRSGTHTLGPGTRNLLATCIPGLSEVFF